MCITLQAIDVDKNRDRYMKFYEQLDQHELNKKIKREVQTTLKSPAKVMKFHETIGVPIPKVEVKHFIFRLVCSTIGHFSQSVPLGEAVLTLEESDLCPKEQEQTKTLQLVMPPQVNISCQIMYVQVRHYFVHLVAKVGTTMVSFWSHIVFTMPNY